MVCWDSEGPHGALAGRFVELGALGVLLHLVGPRRVRRLHVRPHVPVALALARLLADSTIARLLAAAEVLDVSG